MRKLSVLIGTALVLRTGGLTATSASAAGVFSVWDQRDGSRCDFSASTATLSHCANHDYLFQISSDRNVRLYWGSNYTGAYYCVAPGVTKGQPTSPNITFNKGSGSAGYGSSVWNNAASAKF